MDPFYHNLFSVNRNFFECWAALLSEPRFCLQFALFREKADRPIQVFDTQRESIRLIERWGFPARPDHHLQLGRIVELAIPLIHSSVEPVIRTRGARKIAGQQPRKFLVDSSRIVLKGTYVIPPSSFHSTPFWRGRHGVETPENACMKPPWGSGLRGAHQIV